MVKIDNKTIQTPSESGSSAHADYTLHPKAIGDERKNSYIKRHQSRENWKKSGIKTAGFWSRWLLWKPAFSGFPSPFGAWNKYTISTSVKDIEQRFDVKIKRVR
jgi:hypothetical protein